MQCNVSIQRFSKTDMTVVSSSLRTNATLRVDANGPKQATIFITTAFNKDSFSTKNPQFKSSFLSDGKLTIILPEYPCALLISNSSGDTLNVFLHKIYGILARDTSQLPIKAERSDAKKKYSGIACSPQKSKIASPTTSSPQKSKPKISSSPLIKKKCSISIKAVQNNQSCTKQLCMAPRNDQFPTSQHKRISEACATGFNVFFTGGAGTGKSTLLSSIIEDLARLYGKERVFVTATTGLAACAVGGTTIHQFAGIPMIRNENDIDMEEICKKVLSSQLSLRRWRQAKVLLVDEVSMLSPRLLELIDYIGQRTRASNKPVGGIQVIFCGDFFQLPPVVTSSSFTEPIRQMTQLTQMPHAAVATGTGTGTRADGVDDAMKKNHCRFCFQSPVWRQLFQQKAVFVLQKVFRQQEDLPFIKLLEAVRQGKTSENVLSAFSSCVGRKLESINGILPIRIFTHRHDVDTLNAQELSKLPSEEKKFRAVDSGEPAYMAMLQSGCPAKQIIHLKVGSQVILVKTISAQDGLVNGARGIVVKLTKDSKKPIVLFSDGIERTIGAEIFTVELGGRVVAMRTQLPLDLAWAISVHKAQGITVDHAIINLRKVFEYGQAYVALSRVRNLSGLSLASPLLENHVRAHPEVTTFYEQLIQ